ncbi:MAG: tetratricopeptide repeat protein [Opitutaceae bacterium]|nr:tetratricopeptide repeat protein [Opitutaceae bacterium]
MRAISQSFRRPVSLPTLAIILTLMITIFGGCSAQSKREAALRKADSFYEQGQYEHAEIEYLNLLKLNPKDAHAIARVGSIAFEQGRLGRAFEVLSLAKTIAPENISVREQLAFILLSIGNRSEAVAQANAILDIKPTSADAPVILAEGSLDPDSASTATLRLSTLLTNASAKAPILVGLAILTAREGKLEEASQLINQAIAADSKFAAAYAVQGAIHAAQNHLDLADAALARSVELSSNRSPRRVQYAIFKLGRGDRKGARQILENTIEKAPDFFPARVRLAELNGLEGRYDDASAQLSPILAADPNHAEALLISAKIALAQKDTPKAASRIETLLRLYPKFPEAHFEAALMYLVKNEPVQAQNSLIKALAAKPDYREAILLLATVYIRQDNRSEAIVLLRGWLEKSGKTPITPQTFDGYALLAEALFRQGNLTETLSIYDRLEEAVPGREQLALQRGVVLRQLNRPIDARLALTEALRRNPKSVRALEQLVELDFAEKRPGDAKNRVDSALAEQSNTPELQLLSAKIHIVNKELPEAESRLNKAIQLAPDLVQPYLLLTQLQLGRGEMNKALATLSTVLSKQPANREALSLTVAIHEKTKNYSEARKAYEKLLEQEPNSAKILNNLAYLLSEHNKEHEKAYELALKAREIAPDDPNIADTLGWIVFHRGDFGRARNLLRESTAKLPESAESHFHLAMAYAMLGENRLAIDATKQALAIPGDFPSSAEARLRLKLLEVVPAQANPADAKFLEQHLSTHPNDVTALTKLAAVRKRDGNLAEAIALQARAVAASPQSSQLLLTMAEMRAKEGKSAEALELARSARRLAPSDLQLSAALGNLAYSLSDFEWAYTLLQEGSRGTNDPAVLFALGHAAYSLGRTNEAETAYRSANRIQSEPDVSQRLQLIERAAAPNIDPESIALARKRLSANPNDVPALMLLATASIEPTETVRYLERILTVYPKFAPANRLLALTLGESSADDSRALTLLTQAREQYRDDPRLTLALAAVTYRTGDFKRTLTLIDGIRERLPSNADLWFYRGFSQFQLGQSELGTESLKNAIRLGLAGSKREQVNIKLAEIQSTR